jgi:hypothetical protein
MFSLKHIVLIASSAVAVAVPVTSSTASAASPRPTGPPVVVSSKPVSIGVNAYPTGVKGSGSEETCANWDEVLTADNHALSTAVANDYGHDEIAAELQQRDDDAELGGERRLCRDGLVQPRLRGLLHLGGSPQSSRFSAPLVVRFFSRRTGPGSRAALS